MKYFKVSTLLFLFICLSSCNNDELDENLQINNETATDLEINPTPMPAPDPIDPVKPKNPTKP